MSAQIASRNQRLVVIPTNDLIYKLLAKNTVIKNRGAIKSFRTRKTNALSHFSDNTLICIRFK